MTVLALAAPIIAASIAGVLVLITHHTTPKE